MAIYEGYKGAGACTRGPAPGARGFASWYLAKYSDDGGVNSGIYNCRPIRGGQTPSIHGEGRAFDAGVRPYSAKYGTQLANILRLHSKELGIQCIIWNRQIWSGNYTEFRPYKGVNAHVDHLHIELSWKSANMPATDMVNLLEATIGKLVDDLDPDNKPIDVKPAGKPSTPAEKPKTVWQNSKNSKEDNIAIAKALNAMGYNAGKPDGVPGTYLRDGVKAFQDAQIYFPGMKRDGDWSVMTQAHYEWTKELQRELNKEPASRRVSVLSGDGDYRALTGKCVNAVQKGRIHDYRKLGGRVYDKIAGPIFCKLVGLRKHPSA